MYVLTNTANTFIVLVDDHYKSDDDIILRFGILIGKLILILFLVRTN